MGQALIFIYQHGYSDARKKEEAEHPHGVLHVLQGAKLKTILVNRQSWKRRKNFNLFFHFLVLFEVEAWKAGQTLHIAFSHRLAFLLQEFQKSFGYHR